MIAIEWCAVPAGPFTMGSEPAGEHAPDPDEAPAHRVHCPRFRIGRTPVTNAEYRLFVDATSRPAPSHWPGGAVPEERELHPVTYVSWADAAAFCRWAGGFLPTEAQWERAARGDDGRPWPWGDAPPTPAHAVFATTDTASVALAPDGASPFGALDLAGNVWEWTASALRPYPYVAGDGREDGTSPEPRVVRGGSFIHGAGEIRCSSRHGLLPGAVDHYVGFRLAAGADADLQLDVDLVDVPDGEVVLGNDPAPAGGPTAFDESPRHEVVVGAVSLSATAVTNAQYGAFVRATGHSGSAPLARGSRPRRARAASRHLRRLVRRDRLLSLGGGAPADRGRVGESGARGRRPGLSRGAPTSRRPLPTTRRSVPGRSTAERLRSAATPGERARTVSRTWPATSGNG